MGDNLPGYLQAQTPGSEYSEDKARWNRYMFAIVLLIIAAAAGFPCAMKIKNSDSTDQVGMVLRQVFPSDSPTPAPETPAPAAPDNSTSNAPSSDSSASQPATAPQDNPPVVITGGGDGSSASNGGASSSNSSSSSSSSSNSNPCPKQQSMGGWFLASGPMGGNGC